MGKLMRMELGGKRIVREDLSSNFLRLLRSCFSSFWFMLVTLFSLLQYGCTYIYNDSKPYIKINVRNCENVVCFRFDEDSSRKIILDVIYVKKNINGKDIVTDSKKNYYWGIYLKYTAKFDGKYAAEIDYGDLPDGYAFEFPALKLVDGEYYVNGTVFIEDHGIRKPNDFASYFVIKDGRVFDDR